MRTGRVAVGCAATIGALALTVAPATARAANFHLAPRTVAAGEHVRVSGRCQPDTSGWAISRAFRHTARLDYAGNPAVPFTTDGSGRFQATAHVPQRRAPGRYGVTVRCGGGVLAVSRTLRVTSG